MSVHIGGQLGVPLSILVKREFGAQPGHDIDDLMSALPDQVVVVKAHLKSIIQNGPFAKCKRRQSASPRDHRP
jgi:hypothetical protein